MEKLFLNELYYVQPPVKLEELFAQSLHNFQGLLVQLYHYLWKDSCDSKDAPQLLLPHTVLYGKKSLVAWYFTSPKEKKIMKKKKENITVENIWNAFTKDVPSAEDPVAVQIHQDPVPGKAKSAPLKFTYLTGAELKSLLNNMPRYGMGILQKFVPVRDNRNFSIRASWSPVVCFLERSTNRSRLDNSDLPLTAKLSTFDTTNHESEVCVLRDNVVAHTARKLVARVAALVQQEVQDQGKIINMELQIKLGRDGNLWLLYCSAIRVAELQAGSVLERGLSSGGALNRQLSCLVPSPGLMCPSLGGSCGASRPATSRTARGGYVTERDTAHFLCVVTGEYFPAAVKCEVTIKALLLLWYKEVRQLPNEIDRIAALDAIPPPIQRALPNLTLDSYLRRRTDGTFLYRTVPVCELAAARIEQLVIDQFAAEVYAETHTGESRRPSESGYSHRDAPPSRPTSRPTSATSRMRTWPWPRSDRTSSSGASEDPRGVPAQLGDALPGSTWRHADDPHAPQPTHPYPTTVDEEDAAGRGAMIRGRVVRPSTAAAAAAASSGEASCSRPVNTAAASSCPAPAHFVQSEPSTSTREMRRATEQLLDRAKQLLGPDKFLLGRSPRCVGGAGSPGSPGGGTGRSHLSDLSSSSRRSSPRIRRSPASPGGAQQDPQQHTKSPRSRAPFDEHFGYHIPVPRVSMRQLEEVTVYPKTRLTSPVADVAATYALAPAEGSGKLRAATAPVGRRSQRHDQSQLLGPCTEFS